MKMSYSARHKPLMTEETKQKISVAFKGENHPLYGKHLSESTKEKIRAKALGRLHSEKTKRQMSLSHIGEKFSLERR